MDAPPIIAKTRDARVYVVQLQTSKGKKRCAFELRRELGRISLSLQTHGVAAAAIVPEQVKWTSKLLQKVKGAKRVGDGEWELKGKSASHVEVALLDQGVLHQWTVHADRPQQVPFLLRERPEAIEERLECTLRPLPGDQRDVRYSTLVLVRSSRGRHAAWGGGYADVGKPRPVRWLREQCGDRSREATPRADAASNELSGIELDEADYGQLVRAILELPTSSFERAYACWTLSGRSAHRPELEPVEPPPAPPRKTAARKTRLRTTARTDAGMCALWDCAHFPQIEDYDTWAEELLESRDLARQVKKAHLVPLNVGGDGAVDIEIRIATSERAPELSARERRHLLATSEPYRFRCEGEVCVGGIEQVAARAGRGVGRLGLAPGDYAVTAHLIDWESEPGAKGRGGRPTKTALPDLLIFVAPAPAQMRGRTSATTFPRGAPRS